MNRRIHPTMPRELAQQIAWEESGDIRARLMLLDLSEMAYARGFGDRSAASTLLHAAVYLADRRAYERGPWPKGMIKIPETPAVENN